jgi:hypothetical protein
MRLEIEFSGAFMIEQLIKTKNFEQIAELAVKGEVPKERVKELLKTSRMISYDGKTYPQTFLHVYVDKLMQTRIGNRVSFWVEEGKDNLILMQSAAIEVVAELKALVPAEELEALLTQESHLIDAHGMHYGRNALQSIENYAMEHKKFKDDWGLLPRAELFNRFESSSHLHYLYNSVVDGLNNYLLKHLSDLQEELALAKQIQDPTINAGLNLLPGAIMTRAKAEVGSGSHLARAIDKEMASFQKGLGQFRSVSAIEKDIASLQKTITKWQFTGSFSGSYYKKHIHDYLAHSNFVHSAHYLERWAYDLVLENVIKNREVSRALADQAADVTKVITPQQYYDYLKQGKVPFLTATAEGYLPTLEALQAQNPQFFAKVVECIKPMHSLFRSSPSKADVAQYNMILGYCDNNAALQNTFIQKITGKIDTLDGAEELAKAGVSQAYRILAQEALRGIQNYGSPTRMAAIYRQYLTGTDLPLDVLATVLEFGKHLPRIADEVTASNQKGLNAAIAKGDWQGVAVYANHSVGILPEGLQDKKVKMALLKAGYLTLSKDYDQALKELGMEDLRALMCANKLDEGLRTHIYQMAANNPEFAENKRNWGLIVEALERRHGFGLDANLDTRVLHDSIKAHEHRVVEHYAKLGYPLSGIKSFVDLDGATKEFSPLLLAAGSNVFYTIVKTGVDVNAEFAKVGQDPMAVMNTLNSYGVDQCLREGLKCSPREYAKLLLKHKDVISSNDLTAILNSDKATAELKGILSTKPNWALWFKVECLAEKSPLTIPAGKVGGITLLQDSETVQLSKAVAMQLIKAGVKCSAAKFAAYDFSDSEMKTMITRGTNPEVKRIIIEAAFAKNDIRLAQEILDTGLILDPNNELQQRISQINAEVHTQRSPVSSHRSAAISAHVEHRHGESMRPSATEETSTAAQSPEITRLQESISVKPKTNGWFTSSALGSSITACYESAKNCILNIGSRIKQWFAKHFGSHAKDKHNEAEKPGSDGHRR